MDVTLSAGASLFNLNAVIGDSVTCSNKNSIVSANNDFTMSCNSGDLILGSLVIRHRIVSPESCEYNYQSESLVRSNLLISETLEHLAQNPKDKLLEYHAIFQVANQGFISDIFRFSENSQGRA